MSSVAEVGEEKLPSPATENRVEPAKTRRLAVRPQRAATAGFNFPVPRLAPRPGLRRKTHCYTKKLANLSASILLYLLKKSTINT